MRPPACTILSSSAREGAPPITLSKYPREILHHLSITHPIEGKKLQNTRIDKKTHSAHQTDCESMQSDRPTDIESNEELATKSQEKCAPLSSI
jgi:hypothetical protein